MALINWKPRSEMFPAFPPVLENFFRDDDFFNNNWWKRELSTPAVNVAETDKSYDLEVAAPGMKKDDFKLEVKNGVLSISAESKAEKEEKDNGYTRREFSYSSFCRTFWLPENVKADDIQANYKDGILKIMVPKVKVEKAQLVKQIAVA